MGFIKGLIKGGLSLVMSFGDMTKPQPERKLMSPKQYYDYLASLRHRTPEEESDYIALYHALGRRD